MRAGQPFRRTTTGDFFDQGSAGFVGVLLGAKLIAGSAAASAQITDGDGTVLADFSAPANGEGYLNVPVQFRRKVTLGTIAGAGAIVNVWIA